MKTVEEVQETFKFADNRLKCMRTYCTSDELNFIAGLGYWRCRAMNGQIRYASVVPRLELLRRYKKSIEGRTWWGKINRAKVRLQVDKEIAEELERGQRA